MTELKAVVRRGFTGGGIVTLLLAGLFAVGSPPTPSTLLLVGWLAVVGVGLLVAGARERLAVAGRTVEWPRTAAVAIGVLAVGAAVFGLSQLRTLEVASGTWLLTAATLFFALGYFAWFALECWTGGRLLDDEVFAVD